MKEDYLSQLLDSLPISPGVYLMKDHKGKVVYVGKAKQLKNRVRQYFAPSTSDTRYFVNNLRNRLSTIDTVVTSTEKEAILLEYNLIQKYMPRYNIRLMDDKRFLCLRLDPNAHWPKLELIRKPKKDNALYFGPYPSATAARQTLKLVNRYFKLRNCTDTNFKNRVRPCLQYQIKRCLAPCTLDVDTQQYKQQVQFVRLFLEGKKETLRKQLQFQMQEAAAKLEYELAATLRDQVASIEETLAPQRITEISNDDRDIVGIYREGDLVAIVIMEIIKGRLEGRRDFFFKGQEFPTAEILESFVIQQYQQTLRWPDEILLPENLEEIPILQEILSETKGKKVRIYFPKRGKRVEQLVMANANAEEFFKSKMRQKEDVESRLASIQKLLSLPSLPKRMECVDIAHFAGSNTVGAISAVVDGKIDKRSAKVYRVKTASEGDDYGAMREVLQRRFTRAQQKQDGWEAPDLMIIDGGKGQLSIALSVLNELGANEQPIVALAKERQGVKSAPTDRAFLPGRMNPIMVRSQTSSLFLLSMARDEAHRLANGYQEKSRRKNTLKSKLDSIPNVGPKTRNALLKHFGSVKRISQSSLEDIAAIKGIGPKLAAEILETLQSKLTP